MVIQRTLQQNVVLSFIRCDRWMFSSQCFERLSRDSHVPLSKSKRNASLPRDEVVLSEGDCFRYELAAGSE